LRHRGPAYSGDERSKHAQCAQTQTNTSFHGISPSSEDCPMDR
jgi:hypothetical protein